MKEGEFMAKLAKKKQDELINEEITRLSNIFKDLDEERKEIAKSLIQNASFMKVTLEQLQDDVKTKGATYLFEQGSQKMIVENPSQKSYNTMINRYAAIYKQLADLLPKGNKQDQDEFEKWCNA